MRNTLKYGEKNGTKKKNNRQLLYDDFELKIMNFNFFIENKNIILNQKTYI